MGCRLADQHELLAAAAVLLAAVAEEVGELQVRWIVITVLCDGDDVIEYWCLGVRHDLGPCHWLAAELADPPVPAVDGLPVHVGVAA